MKKIYSIAMLAVLALCAFSFTSCGNDDDEDTPSQEDHTYASTHFAFDAEFTQDMIDAFDIKMTATYYDGTTETVTVNKLKAADHLDTPLKDAVMKMHYTISIKPTFEVTEGKQYNFHYSIWDQAATYDKSDKVIYQSTLAMFAERTLQKDAADLKGHEAELKEDMEIDITRVCTVKDGTPSITVAQ